MLLLTRDCGCHTCIRGMIFLAIDPFKELSFFGLFNSIVRTPYV